MQNLNYFTFMIIQCITITTVKLYDGMESNLKLDTYKSQKIKMAKILCNTVICQYSEQTTNK